MNEQLIPKKLIEPPLNDSSKALAVSSEELRKGQLIAEYLRKYAVVEGRAVTEEQITVFYEALSDYDLGKLEKGLRRYLKKGTRWPWPGLLAEWIENEV